MDLFDIAIASEKTENIPAAAFACLERSGTVVTGNARAARELVRRFSEARRLEGSSAWLTPEIFDWESWLARLWQQHLMAAPEAPLLLTPLQERLLWKRIVDRTAPKTAEDNTIESIAILAADAYELLCDYRRHGELRASWKSFGTTDQEIFRNWAARFDRQAAQNGWMSRSALPELLADSFRKGVSRPPAELLLIGFDRLTPAQETLLQSCVDAGCRRVMLIEKVLNADPPRLVEAKDIQDELFSCAWWSRRILEQKPESRVGVIARITDELRGDIDRTFRAVLPPESWQIGSPVTVPYELSLGEPISAIPLIRAALVLLRWITTPLDQAAASWLLMSGFFAASSDHALESAKLDATVRKRGKMPPQVSIEWFLKQYAEKRELIAGFDQARLAAQRSNIASNRQSFSEWVDLARNLLRKAAWPGARPLNSFEFQARRRWERMLDEVAMLSFDGSRIDYGEFVTVLDRMSAETIFAPESRNAPIQIMGVLESAGQEFDAVWFLGADDRQWPSTARPNPLIPIQVQREAAMPHASLEADWMLAKQVTGRIAACAPSAAFSYAAQNNEGQVRPSTLLAGLCGGEARFVRAVDLRAELGIAKQSRHKAQTVQVQDNSAIPWPPEKSAGGIDVLKMQSACPFQAFAAYRLGAKELDSAERGLTPLDRGNILHKVLEGIWSEKAGEDMRLHTRDDLLNAQASHKLETIVTHHVDEVFAQFQAARQQTGWSTAFYSLEKQRLKSLLLRWFETEAKRTPFAVEVCEKKIESVDISGVKLNLRVDRIDSTSGGGRVLIDYKTSTVTPAKWRGSRPDEPQLPIYSIYGDVEDLRGVFFAQIRADELTFAGHADESSPILAGSQSRSGPFTEAMRDEWEETLRALAEQFASGVASVDPKRYPQTCKYCALPGLCRVAETQVAVEAVEDENGSDDDEPIFTEDWAL